MARDFTAYEAKVILKSYQNTENRIKKLGLTAEYLRSEVQNIAQSIILDGTLSILKTVPVEELNRTRKGIRVKPLKDSGYETVADIVSADSYRLSAVNGISPEGAQDIKNAAKELYAEAQKSSKIRLSADEKTQKTSALILSLYKYKRLIPAMKAVKEYKASLPSGITSAESEIKPATGSVRWLFTSSEKKTKAQSAYDKLSFALNKANEISLLPTLDSALSFSYITEKDAWADFVTDSISYVNLLENLSPDSVGTGNEIYGLPEELAQRVADTKLNLSGLKCTLRHYQEWGVKYTVAQGRVLLGDEMGLGKTVQAIAAMVHLRNCGDTHFAVICPAAVLTNWCRETEKHSDLKVIKVHGAGKNAALSSWIENGGVAVTTYETTAVFDLDESFRIGMVVVDEAHYIKNPDAKRTQNAKNLCAKANRLLFMTGTALENRVSEMSALISVLNTEVYNQIKPMLSLSSAQKFKETVAPVYYRRKREDVLTELPELIESKEWCPLYDTEADAYKEALAKDNFMAARRVSWNIDDLTYSSKASRLLQLVENARAEGRKVLVFSFFLDTVHKVAALIGENCCEPITGSLSPSRRQEIIDEFDKANDGCVLVAQIQSGGTGLNIQSASVVIICEPQLKPSIENQAISRAYRMGQARSVLVYRLLCDDTIDERITDLLAQKQKEFDAFADDSKAAEDTLELDSSAVNSIMQSERTAFGVEKSKDQ